MAIKYITKEAAKEAFCVYMGFTSMRAAIAADCIFDAIPAANVRPVVHGHWEEPDDDYGYFICSNCEERSPNDECWNYCPFCGADMRGK